VQFGKYDKGQDLGMGVLIKIVNAFDISSKEFFSEGLIRLLNFLTTNIATKKCETRSESGLTRIQADRTGLSLSL
jgi:hypothetical protein